MSQKTFAHIIEKLDRFTSSQIKVIFGQKYTYHRTHFNSVNKYLVFEKSILRIAQKRSITFPFCFIHSFIHFFKINNDKTHRRFNRDTPTGIQYVNSHIEINVQ